MTSPNARDANCKGCSKPTEPPGVIVEHNEITRASTDDHMVSVLRGLPEYDDVRYSSKWVIYMGGPPEVHLFAINSILPPEADRISIDHEGHLEYKKGPGDFESPSPIDGFCRDEENDHLFLPLWESCVWRHYNIAFKLNCQCINIISRCGKTDQITDYATCKQCEDRLEIPLIIVPEMKTISSLRYPEGLPIHSSKPKTHGTT